MSQEYMDIAVAGLHLTGQPLNIQLVELGGKLTRTCRTSTRYKMFLIEDSRGKKPGLVQLPHNQTGNAFDVEVWSIPMTNVGKLLVLIPAPLGLGSVVLEDDTTVKGFICEHRVTHEGKDISGFSGWKSFLASQ